MATETEEEDRQVETKALLATRPEEEVQQAGTEALLATGAVPVTNGTARMAKAKMKKRTTTWRRQTYKTKRRYTNNLKSDKSPKRRPQSKRGKACRSLQPRAVTEVSKHPRPCRLPRTGQNLENLLKRFWNTQKADIKCWEKKVTESLKHQLVWIKYIKRLRTLSIRGKGKLPGTQMSAP